MKTSVIPFSTPEAGSSAAADQPRPVSPPAGAAEAESAARDWLRRQRRLVEAWRDALIADLADARLIAALDQHALFLRQLDDH